MARNTAATHTRIRDTPRGRGRAQTRPSEMEIGRDVMTEPRTTAGFEALLRSNLLRISAHLFGAPLPCPSPCSLPGVFSLCPMDHLTVRTLWYFSRYFSHFSLPRNVLHCEGIEPHTFCFLSLIFDSVACATVQWLSLT